MAANTTKYKLSNANDKLNSGAVFKANVAEVKSNPWGYLGSAIPAFNYSMGANGIGAAGSGSYLLRIGAYLAAILVVVLIILLFVHFFVTPIFNFQPGAPGIITLPGFDDGKLFWNKTNAALIKNKDLPISAAFFNYSLNVDMFIQDPMQFSSKHRVLLSRGASARNAKPTGDTITAIFTTYNLVIAMAPDTTDLIVSVLNSANNMENIVLYNVPIQEPFRLGIVVMEKALEVYLNGKLKNTRSFSATLLDAKGDIDIAVDAELNIAKLQNLKIWNRVLSTSEIINATPAVATVADFGATAIPSSSSCPAPAPAIIDNALNTINNTMSRFDNTSK